MNGLPVASISYLKAGPTVWKAGNMPNGVYLVELVTGGKVYRSRVYLLGLD